VCSARMARAGRWGARRHGPIVPGWASLQVVAEAKTRSRRSRMPSAVEYDEMIAGRSTLLRKVQAVLAAVLG